jgi:Ca2+-binding RTX toxin-like protein
VIARRTALMAGLAAAALGVAADQAAASYSGQVVNGTFRITGNGASDKLVLFIEAGLPGNLLADVGADGTIDFSLNRSEFVATLGGADTITSGLGLASPLEVNADGGDGPDTLRYAGTAGDDTLTIAPNGGEITTVGLDPASRLDSVAIEDVRLEGLGGADTIAAAGQAPLPAQITFDGGPGNDTLRGSGGGDSVLGGSGNDEVMPARGNDAVLLGSGNDVVQWGPGDGNDSIEGEAGADRIEFSGSAIAEALDVSPSGGRVVLRRNIASVAIDFDGVETLALRPLAGADTITVNDTTGTALAVVDADLHAVTGTGDGAPDTVITNGTDAVDSVRVRRLGSQAAVGGIGAETRVSGELGLDTLRIQTLGGNDKVEVGDIWDLITPVVDLGADE